MVNQDYTSFRPPFKCASSASGRAKIGKYVVDSNRVFFCEADNIEHANTIVGFLNGSAKVISKTENMLRDTQVILNKMSLDFEGWHNN